jgi:hypothetical protein
MMEHHLSDNIRLKSEVPGLGLQIAVSLLCDRYSEFYGVYLGILSSLLRLDNCPLDVVLELVVFPLMQA